MSEEVHMCKGEGPREYASGQLAVATRGLDRFTIGVDRNSEIGSVCLEISKVLEVIRSSSGAA